MLLLKNICLRTLGKIKRHHCVHQTLDCCLIITPKHTQDMVVVFKTELRCGQKVAHFDSSRAGVNHSELLLTLLSLNK